MKVESVDDTGPLQDFRVIGLIGELRDGVPRVGEWGFASHPPEGSQAVAIALGGDREDLVVIGCEDRDTRRRGLPEGAAALYSAAPSPTECTVDANGNANLIGGAAVTIRGGTGILLQVGATAVAITDAGIVITSPSVTVNGMNLNTHTHSGVQAGAGNTGPPV